MSGQDSKVRAPPALPSSIRRWARSARCLFALAGAGVWACSVTLDPTIAPEAARPSQPGSGGAAGAAGSSNAPQPNPACVAVTGTEERLVVCSSVLSQADAAADCAALGGHLAKIGSATVDAAVTEAARAHAETTNIWLGGMRDELHFWSWPDGSIFWHGRFDGVAPEGVYTNFMAGEPNNTASTTELPEPCLALVLSSGLWNDRGCDLALSYACELAP